MGSLSRALARKNETYKSTLEKRNADSLKVSLSARYTPSIVQEHATKGLKVRSKKSMAIAQMTPQDRWNKLIAPVIHRAQAYKVKHGL